MRNPRLMALILAVAVVGLVVAVVRALVLQVTG